MRRPLLSVLIFLALSLAVAFAVASDTAIHSWRASSSGGCAASCSRQTTTSRTSLIHAGERHGNPTVVPHAFVY